MNLKIKLNISFLVLLSMCFFVACNCKKQTVKNEKLEVKSYNATMIDTLNISQEIFSFEKLDDQFFLITAYDKEKNLVNDLYIVDHEFSNYNKINVNWHEKNINELKYTCPQNGNIICLTTFSESKIEEPDNNEIKYKLYEIDKNGNIIFENILNFNDNIENNSLTNDIISSKDRICITRYSEFENIYTVFDISGNYIGEVDTSSFSSISSVCFTANGELAILGNEINSDENIVKFLDIDSLKPIKTISLPIDKNYNNEVLFTGTQDIPVYLYSSRELIAIYNNGKISTIINWLDSNMNYFTADNVIKVSEDKFIISGNESDDLTKIYIFSKNATSDLSDTTIITIGMLSDNLFFDSYATKYNKTHSDTKIKLVKYNNANSDTSNSGFIEDSLMRDFITGNSPDMILSTNRSIIHSMAEKNIFVDLYPMMDNGNMLTRSDILPNILSASEINKKMYSISPYFYIDTMISKKKFVNKENWSIDDMLEYESSMPKDMNFFEDNSRQNVINILNCSLEQFIDIKTKKCNFKTAEFNKYIAFFEKFILSEDNYNISNNAEQLVDIEDYIDSNDNFRNDKFLTKEFVLNNFRKYIENKALIGLDEFIFTGYPSDDGHGGYIQFPENYAILSTSNNKQQCWNIITDVFEVISADKKLYDNYFPTLETDFNELAEDSTKYPVYSDENGDVYEDIESIYVGNNEVSLTPLSIEEKEKLVNYIKNIKKEAFSLPSDINTILFDELMAWAYEEKTKDEVINSIDSRISILMSEKS